MGKRRIFWTLIFRWCWVQWSISPKVKLCPLCSKPLRILSKTKQLLLNMPFIVSNSKDNTKTQLVLSFGVNELGQNEPILYLCILSKTLKLFILSKRYLTYFFLFCLYFWIPRPSNSFGGNELLRFYNRYFLLGRMILRHNDTHPFYTLHYV